VFVDGQPIGNTPMASVSIAPGTHIIRVMRSGFQSYEREIQVAPCRIEGPFDRRPKDRQPFHAVFFTQRAHLVEVIRDDLR